MIINSAFVKIILGLLRQKESIPSGVVKKDSFYPGLNGNEVPVKVVYPETGYQKIFVIFPGASPHAETHPEMTKMAYLLASLPIKMYIPRLPLLKELIISRENTRWMSHFYHWIVKTEPAYSQSIYLIGMSFGGALLLKSIIEEPYFEPEPAALLTYGTFNNFSSTMDFLISGYYYNGRNKQYLKPHDWGKIVLFNNYLNKIYLDFNIDNIQKNIFYLVHNDPEKAAEHRGTLNDFEQLFLNDLIKCIDNPYISIVMEKIRTVCKEELISLSPKYWVHRIQSKVFILHGVNDNMIPFTESIDLSELLLNSELLITKLYSHSNQNTHFSGLFKLVEAVKLLTFLLRFINYNANKDISGRI